VHAWCGFIINTLRIAEENLLDSKPSEKTMSIVFYVVLQLPLLLLANFNSS